MIIPRNKRFTREEAAKLCGVHVQTVSRWISKGVFGVKLIPEYMGAKPWITQEAIDDFNRRIREKRLGVQEEPEPAPKTSREDIEYLRSIGCLQE